jgi:hypothetical protein
MTINTAADNTDTTSTTPRNVSDQELQEFRAFRDSKIRAASLQEGQNMATAAHLADEQAADEAALKKLTDKNLSLRDVFGNSSTDRGRGVLINIHRSGFGSKTTTFARLRRMAAASGLVK